MTVEISRTDNSPVALWLRCQLANDYNAKTFVSVHHNSAETCPDDSANRSEVLFSTYLDECVMSNGVYDFNCEAPKDTTNLLARKIGYKLRDTFGKKYDDFRNPIDKSNLKRVLSRTEMASVITEASFTCINAEADSFYYNYDNHREWEAQAIWEGVSSFLAGQGISLVDFEYQDKSPTSDPTFVSMETGSKPSSDKSVPYQGTWLLDEHIELYAKSFSKGVYDYTFHHWEWRDFNPDTVIESYFVNPISFFVWPAWDDSTHYWTAYFTGGHFETTIRYPDSLLDTMIQANSNFTINWDAPNGARNSCSLYVDLSTNSGSTWSSIIGPIPYDNSSSQKSIEIKSSDSKATGTYDWLVPNITSNFCKLRIIAFDMAGNRDTAISHQFEIDCFQPTSEFSYVTSTGNESGNVPFTVDFTDESAFAPSVWLWDFGDGNTSTSQNPRHIFNTSGLFTVTLTTTNQCGGFYSPYVDLFDVSCSFLADFSPSIDSGSLPLTVTFVDNSVPSNAFGTYEWNYGDGTIDTTTNMTSGHTYTTQGVYTVKVNALIQCGAVDTVSKKCLIKVSDSNGNLPVSDFDGDNVFDICDNCPTVSNPIQGDIDENGIGDLCTYTCNSSDSMDILIGHIEKFEMVTDIAQLPSLDIIVIGNSDFFGFGRSDLFITKTDVCGNILFTKDYFDVEGTSISLTYDSNIVITGNKTIEGNIQIYLGKFNLQGDIIWEKTFGGAYIEEANSVINTSDMGFAIAGKTNSEGNGAYDFYLVKTDSLGNFLWSRTFGSSVHDEANSIIETIDNGFALIGYTDELGTGKDMFLVRTDEFGNLIWSKTYGSPKIQKGYDLKETNYKKGFILAGSYQTDNLDDDMYLVKVDSLGVEEWSKQFGGVQDEVAYSIEVISNNYYLSGLTNSFGPGVESIYIVKVKPDGDTLWTNVVGDTNNNRAKSIIKSTNDGYIIGGNSYHSDNSFIHLLRFPVETCCIGIRGNVDGDSQELVDIGDMVYLSEFMFQGGPPPSCYEEGNVDGDPQDIVDISDLVYLVDFMFSDPIGPEPPSCY